jgi:ferritin-like metal-binding protein YciE
MVSGAFVGKELAHGTAVATPWPVTDQQEERNMAETLRDAFIDELKDAYDGEKQLTKALPKMAKAATSPDLRTAFESHLEETRGQISRLEQVFELLDEKAKGKRCEGIAGIIEEASAVMGEDFDEETMDASLIAAGQRAEHYEMAAYGTLVAWAQALGESEAAQLLEQTLNEEKAADKKLTMLAEGGINQQAADAGGDEEESEEEDEDEPPVKAKASASTRR